MVATLKYSLLYRMVVRAETYIKYGLEEHIITRYRKECNYL